MNAKQIPDVRHWSGIISDLNEKLELRKIILKLWRIKKTTLYIFKPPLLIKICVMRLYILGILLDDYGYVYWLI